MADRSSLKATPLKVMKVQEENHKQITGQGNDRAGFLTLQKGVNKLRIFPAHPDDLNPDVSWIYPKGVHWVPVELKDDDGKTKEVKNLPVFNSRIHFDSKKKDVVEQYVEMVKKILGLEIQDKTILATKLEPILDWKKGLGLNSSWIFYAKQFKADGTEEIGRVEITNGTKEKINALCAKEKSNEPIETDPFTDPDDGICLILTYTPDAKDAKGQSDKKNYYNVDLDRQKTDKFNYKLVPTPLTENDVETFFKLESLEALYKNCYTRRDFTRALRGLELVDEREGYGIFASPEWLLLVEEISNYYPDSDDESSTGAEDHSSPQLNETAAEVQTVVTQTSNPVDEVEDEVEDAPEEELEEDQFATMTRDQLKAFNKTELGGAIVIMKSYTDDHIRELIRNHMSVSSQSQATQPAVTAVEKPVAKVDPPVAKAEVKKEVPPVTEKAGSRLEELKKKHGLK